MEHTVKKSLVKESRSKRQQQNTMTGLVNLTKPRKRTRRAQPPPATSHRSANNYLQTEKVRLTQKYTLIRLKTDHCDDDVT